MSVSSFATNRTSAVLRGAVALTLGLVLTIWPEVVSNTIVYILGACLILSGIIAGIVSFRQMRSAQRNGRTVSYVSFMGGGNLLFGLLLVIFPDFFLSVLMYLLAAIVLVFSMLQMLSLYYTSRMTKVNPLLYVIPGLLAVGSIAVFFKPAASINTIMIFIGVIIIVYAVTELAEAWVFRNVTVEDKYKHSHQIEDVTFEETEK